MAAGAEDQGRGPTVGLVIVDYRSWEQTRCALAAALASSRQFDRIVIVDTGGATPCTDCRTLSDRIVLLRAERNGGFAYGVNLGLRVLQDAGVTHTMILNPDARPDPETLSVLLAALEKDPAIGIVAPVSFTDTGRRQTEFAGARAQWHLGRLAHRTRLRPSPEDITDEPFVTACCWLLRMEVFEKVGPLPEGYFLYFEDTDYCQSVQRAGYRTVLARTAEIVHLGSQTVGRHSPLYRYQFARNRIWFMRRWARWDQMASFIVFTLLVKIPLAIVLFGLRDRDPAALRAFLWGTWEGLSKPVFEA